MYSSQSAVQFLDGEQHVAEEQGVVEPALGRAGQLLEPVPRCVASSSGRTAGPRSGDDAGAGALDHGERPAQEVADAVREFALLTVVTMSAVREVSVLPERHFAQEEVAEGIGTELVDHLVGIDDIAAAFGHLLAVHRPPPRGRRSCSGAVAPAPSTWWSSRRRAW
jgi:hypothetical protein